jgi:hypothetical protein
MSDDKTGKTTDGINWAASPGANEDFIEEAIEAVRRLMTHNHGRPLYEWVAPPEKPTIH